MQSFERLAVEKDETSTLSGILVSVYVHVHVYTQSSTRHKCSFD